MTSQAEAGATLRAAGALLEGHFQYTSGRHGSWYIEKFRLLEDPPAITKFCQQITDRFRAADVAAVAGPATGGIIVAFETARLLGVRALFAEKPPGGSGRVFARGFRFHPGERTLVVDDVLTTGGSVLDTLAAVRAAGATPVGVGVLVDRSGGSVDFALPFYACLTVNFEALDPVACPLCRQGIPLTPT